MKSGGGVLSIAGLQVIVGLCLLGIYEGYKVCLRGACVVLTSTKTQIRNRLAVVQARYLKDQISQDKGAADNANDEDHIVFIRTRLFSSVLVFFTDCKHTQASR